MVRVAGGVQPPLPPVDDRGPGATPGAAVVDGPVNHSTRRAAAPRDASPRARPDGEPDAAAPSVSARSIELPYARIGIRYVPAGKGSGLGGDWYEAAQLPDGRMFLAVGDVSGHGKPAIAEMAQFRHALFGLTRSGASPGRLLARLNTLVLDRFGDTTATVVCGHFDPGTRCFAWAQAGHPAPVLVRGGVARQLAAPPGVVLGAAPGLPYGVANVQLQPGDLLLMFSDGLVERRRRDIGEGVSLALRAAAEISDHDDLDSGLDRLVEAIGGPNPEDDTCLLAVSVRTAAGQAEAAGGPDPAAGDGGPA